MSVDQDISDFLEHHGVKGQRWGVRNTIKRIQRNRALNQAAKEKQRAKEAAQFEALRKKLRPGAKKLTRAQDIQRARDRINTGAAKADKKAAKAQYKKDKITKGSKEARRILRKRKDALLKDYYRSQEVKSGLEAAHRIIDQLNNQIEVDRIRRERAAYEAEQQARQAAREAAFRARYTPGM